MPPPTHQSDRKRRKARRRAAGLTRAQKRHSSNPRTRATKAGLPADYPHFKAAIRRMNRGESLTAAARKEHVWRDSLRRFLIRHGLAKRKGRRWVIKDNWIRQVPVITAGRRRMLTVRGYEPARLVGEHHHAAAEFVRRNDIALLESFRGQSVQAANGRRYVLETDPNVLHRVAAMDTPPFHEVYEIIATK